MLILPNFAKFSKHFKRSARLHYLSHRIYPMNSFFWPCFPFQDILSILLLATFSCQCIWRVSSFQKSFLAIGTRKAHIKTDHPRYLTCARRKRPDGCDLRRTKALPTNTMKSSKVHTEISVSIATVIVLNNHNYVRKNRKKEQVHENLVRWPT